MKKWLLSIKTRITMWYLLAMIILLIFFGLMAYFLMAQGLSQKSVAPWNLRIAQTEKSVDGSIKITGFQDITDFSSAPDYSSVLTIKGFDSNHLSESRENNDIQIGNFAGKSILVDKTLLQNQGPGPEYQIWFYVYIFKNDLQNYKLLIVFQTTNDIFTMSVFRRTMFIVTGLTLVIAGIIGFFLITLILRPIKKITRSAQEISEKNLTLLLKTEPNDELGELSATLNQMLERLANAFKREEQLTADVSHALRTPLTIAQGEATLALRGERSPEEYRRTIEIISQEIAHLTSITNRLLFLARADHNQKLDLVEIGLAKLLDELVADLEVIAEDKHISLRLDSSENLAVKGDPQRIRELFTSLIDNAIRFTPAGGNINVSVRKLGAYAVIAVSDTGIGIAEELLEHIFERLYRVNTQNLKDHGAGLGLAISKRIVEMHKGKIEVISTMGKGSTFSVFLPVIDK